MITSPFRIALAAAFLPLLFLASAHAATVNVSAGGNLGAIVAAASPGDTVVVGAGTFNVTTPITVPTGVTLTGVSVSASHIVFNVAGGDFTSYGILIAPNASNITLENLDLYSNHGLVQMSNGSQYTNITIAYNNLQYGNGELSDGSLVYGISATIASTNLQITHNYFHDSPNSVRNWCVFSTTNSNFDYNLFYNINDGGQCEYPGPNVSFSYNYGTYMHRMGQECALVTQSTYTCVGNVFYNYVLPYNDTEGVSIVGLAGAVTISNNYFDANIAAGSTWGTQSGAAAGGPNRFGYAIEATGSPGTVSGNTLVGVWAEDVSSDIAGLIVSNNSVYGTALWGDFEGEPGPLGYGGVVLSNNLTDASVADAPTPPTNTFAGVNFNGSTTNSTGSSGSNGSGSTGSGSTGSGSTGSGSTGAGSTGTGTSGTGSTGKGSTGNGTTHFGSGNSGSRNQQAGNNRNTNNISGWAAIQWTNFIAGHGD